MAFLCPVRMRRDKKKATNANIERDLPLPGAGVSMGRITGSSSIETLVRVGIEKEHGLSPDSKMVVLVDFTPCVDDELEVKRGQIVNILYRENDWVYVIGQDSRQEGFIPYSYCAPYNTAMAELAIKKKLPREQVLNAIAVEHVAANSVAAAAVAIVAEQVPLLSGEVKIECGDELGGVVGSGGGGVGAGASLKNSELNAVVSIHPIKLEAECMPFHKEPTGRFIVLYTFIARDENDLSVERGEFVTVLNRDDADWFWIVRSDGQEGFIPAAFVYPADSVLQTQKLLNEAGGGGGGSGGLNKATTNSAQEVSSNLVGNLNSLGQPLTTTTTPGGGQMESLQQQQLQQQQQQNQQQIGIGTDDLRYHGTELVMLYDYKAQAPDDLSVRRGDWIYADLNNQTVDGWLWAYAPKTRKYGFIPKTYARPPAMTSL